MTSWKTFCRGGLVLVALQISVAGVHAEGEPAAGPYKLAPGDTVAVAVAGEADLSGTFAINNLGEIAIPLVGSVTIGDRTVAESQEAIKQAALSKNILRNPLVFVRVETYRSISILGEVRNPGVYPYLPGKLAKMVIAQAGGYGQPGYAAGPADTLLANERATNLAVSQDRLLTRQARLLAQLSGATDFTPPKLQFLSSKAAERLIEEERSYIGAQSSELSAQIAALDAQRPQLTAEEASVDAQIDAETHQVNLLKSRLTEHERLESKGLSRSENIIQLRLSISAKEGNVWALKAQRSRGSLAKMELGQKIRDLMIQNNARLTTALDDVRRQLMEVDVTLPSARQIATRRLQPSATSPAEEPTYTISIVRHRGSERLEIEATDTTLLEPGDLLEVRSQIAAARQQNSANVAPGKVSP